LLGARANANEVFEYDNLGRLIRVTYANGRVLSYQYDVMGNRTLVQSGGQGPGTPETPPFNATINVPGGGAVNLRSLANAAGYTGTEPATIQFVVAAGVTILGAGGAGATPDGGLGIDTGAWPTAPHAPSLSLLVRGQVYGGGGKGGDGSAVATVPDGGFPGGAGGDAVVCRTPIAITIEPGGAVRAGGGGGGGGGNSSYWFALGQRTNYLASGGGGGGFPNGGASTSWTAVRAYPGQAGTFQGGGVGGAGEVTTVRGTVGVAGAGGVGGGSGAAGATGGVGVPSARAPGAGGPGGYAVRKSGHQAPVTNNGTISGAVA
jgi:YD repeat-containing protein